LLVRLNDGGVIGATAEVSRQSGGCATKGALRPRDEGG